MSTAASPTRMTLEQFLALPEDGMDRELIAGEVRERPMTRRNRFHAASESKVAHVLRSWLDRQPQPRGEVYSGEVGCILGRNPGTTVGIDVAYFSAEAVARQTDETSMMEAAPVLAVEILSPTDKQEEIAEKVDTYLNCGVALVWVLDPHFQTVAANSPPKCSTSSNNFPRTRNCRDWPSPSRNSFDEFSAAKRPASS